MKLTPLKQLTFWVSVILAVLGLFGRVASLPLTTRFSFWLVLLAFVVLALGNVVEDL